MLLSANSENNGNNGNHYGHYKGDHADRDDVVDNDNPYPDNSDSENIEEEIKSSLNVVGATNEIYYATQNQDVYINIHIYNPDNFEILSFTLNGKKYSSYMFEEGSDMETIVLKYNVGAASGIVEYTIDAIKYIDGTEIKDVIIDGDKTVTAGIKTVNQLTASISGINIDTNALSFNVNVADKDNLIAFSSGALKAVIYDGAEIVAQKDLAVGENSITFENLKTNTLYQYAIVGYYDDLAGNGFKMNVLYKDVFYTDAVVLFDNIDVGQDSISFGYVWHEVHQNKSISALKLYKDGTFVKDITASSTSVEELLSGTTYTLIAEYPNANTTESIYIEFTTLTKAVPEISLVNSTKTQTSVGFEISETDADNVGAVTKIELIHASGTIVADSLDQRAFANLLSNNAYTVKITYVYDLNDGEGEQTVTKELAITTLAKAVPEISVVTLSNTQTSISFEVNKIDVDNVGAITKIELVHQNGTIIADSLEQRVFENLLSGNEYTIKITYKYDLNDGEGEKVSTKEISASTISKAVPTLSITTVEKTKDSISFGVVENDIDNVGAITKIELINPRGTIVADSIDQRTFSNLLSNNEYTLKITYTYDLNDGKGAQTITQTEQITTDAKSAPSITFDNAVSNSSAISFGINKIDADGISEIIKIELLLENDVVRTTTDGTVRTFTDLLSNTEYTVKVSYVYDLNDGSGKRTETREIKIKTFSKVKPSIIFETTDRTKTSVSFDFNIVDVDNIGYIERIELLKNGDVVSITTNGDDKEFVNLLSNTKYTVKVIFAYDLNDGKGVAYIEKTADITTYAKSTPEISISNPSKTQTSIGFSVTETDTDNVGAVAKIELYKGNELVKTADSLNTREFTELLSNNTYTVKVTYVYDLNDGEGKHTVTRELAITTIAKAIPDFTISNTNKTQTSLEFSIDITDTDSVGVITMVELIHGTDITILGNVTAHAINDLLSNNDYTIKVTYTYDLNDGVGNRTIVHELTAKTIAKATPEISVHTPTKSQTSVGFSIDETDTDNVGTFTKIELYKGNELVKTADSLNTREFIELLSNNTYTVEVTYVYDLNDGEGKHTVTRELAITTYAKAAPSFNVKNESITTNGINVQYDITDVDNILSAYKVELYKGNTLVSENSDKKIDFTELSYYTDYTVKITYVYDLNDGNGNQTSIQNYNFKTLPYIDVTECSIANTSAVSEGETIFMSVKLDNPLGMTIESVVINGEIYNVTGASTKNKIFVEIVYNGQFAGGDTYLKIDQVNAKIDSTPLSIEPKTELSDNVFINGKLEVLKIEFVNDRFEPMDWAFPTDKVYILITLDNPTDFTIDSVNENITTLTKIDNNRWYYSVSLYTGWNYRSLSSLSYHNEYIHKTITYSDMNTNYFYSVASKEIKYISTPDDLKNMSDSYYYELKNDIDLAGLEWQGSEFDGVFDGKGYSIKNMSFVGTVKNTDAYLGLFSHGNGVIQNVNIEEATIIAEVTSDDGNEYSAYCGGLIGRLTACLIIHGCTVDECTIIDVKNFVGYVYAGGLVGGDAAHLTITNCTNSGSVSVSVSAIDSEAYAGGLVGSASHLIITNCTNSGSVSVSVSATDSEAYAGGLVGGTHPLYATVNITNCTNSGSVSATSYSYAYAGGLVGETYDLTIANSTNSGSVSGSATSYSYAYAGGLVGSVSHLTITNCTNSGSVSATSHYAHGLVGGTPFIYVTVTITNSYSLVSGNSAYDGEACTIEQLNSKEFYTETLGWSEDIWDFSELDVENGKYPQLKQ